MPLFFAISGFCYHTIEKPDYKNYINKKIKRLLIPYFFIGFIEIIVKQIFASFVNSAQGLGDSISSMILGGGYWFLYTLFIIFLIFPFLESMYMKNRCFFIAINIIALILYFADILPRVFNINAVAHYLFYFSFGYVVHRNLGQISDMWQRNIHKGFVALILAVIWLGCICLVENKPDNSINIYLLFIASLVGIWLLVILAQLLKKYPCRMLCDFSKYSLQLYLLNGYLLGISRMVIVKVLAVESPVLIIGFNMLVTLFFSWILIRCFISKFKLFRYIFGIM